MAALSFETVNKRDCVKFLVLGASHCLSRALAREGRRRADIVVEAHEVSALEQKGWVFEQCDAVIVPPLSHPASATPAEVLAHAALVEEVLSHCVAQELPLVWCVSDEMFEAGSPTPISESLVPDPIDKGLRRLVQAGMRVREELPRHIILRVGPLFALDGEHAWLPDIIATLTSGNDVRVPEDVVVGPASAESLAMALIGILMQLKYGADSWGSYHLSGIEPVSLYAFCGVVRTQMVTLLEGRGLSVDFGDVKPLSHHHDQPLRRVLRCQRLLDTFGIHQRPWRVELERLLMQWCETQTQQGVSQP